MNESPAASIALWFASEIIPASATTVTCGRRWEAGRRGHRRFLQHAEQVVLVWSKAQFEACGAPLFSRMMWRGSGRLTVRLGWTAGVWSVRGLPVWSVMLLGAGLSQQDLAYDAGLEQSEMFAFLRRGCNGLDFDFQRAVVGWTTRGAW